MIETARRIANVEEYYFSRKLAEVRGLDTPAIPVINLGIGSPDLTPDPSAVEALIKTAEDPSGHGYQSYKGIPALRQGISAFYKKIYNVNLSPETEILPLMGSKEGIMHITLAFVNEGDEVLIPDPGYPTYASIASLAGAKIRTYEMKESLDWGVDLESLRKQDLSRVKLMWVNFPHMPTGRVASAQEMDELVALARKHQFLIVNDNPYSLILNDVPLSILASNDAQEVALELNSLSKSHNMAGWRIGWVAGKKDFIDAILKVKSNMDSGMFLGLQQAAVAALRLEDDWFAELNKVYTGRSIVARKILHDLGCTCSERQSGLFVWAKVPATIPDVEKWVDEILYATKVFITPGFIFGQMGKRHVRLSLCAPIERMEEALDRIRHWKKSKTQPSIKAAL